MTDICLVLGPTFRAI